jgi:glyoxylase-like metal-dependent hydrolase (beta-lactamase superfamily II)
MEVADGVQLLTQGVTNFYLIEDAGKFTLVDAGTPKDWDFFIRSLATIEHSQLHNLEAVLLTHAHPDHTGFAERARTEAGARVWVHEADAESARTGKVGTKDGKIPPYLLKAEFYRTFFSLGRRGAAKMIPIKEVSSFADGETIGIPGRPRAVLAPGHTPGSAALLLEDRRVLFSGDVLATRNPLTGRLGPQIMPSALNEDTAEALRSLDALRGVTADVLLPGHGDPYRDGMPAAIAAAKAAGRS